MSEPKTDRDSFAHRALMSPSLRTLVSVVIGAVVAGWTASKAVTSELDDLRAYVDDRVHPIGQDAKTAVAALQRIEGRLSATEGRESVRAWARDSVPEKTMLDRVVVEAMAATAYDGQVARGVPPHIAVEVVQRMRF